MFIQIFTGTREIYISHSGRENIPCRVGRGRRGERRADLARRWSALDSLGTKRSWNVLWKLLWKALRGTDRTGAPGFSLLLHTCCHDDEEAPLLSPWNPAGPYMRSRPSSSLSFPLRANKLTVFSIDPRKCLVFHHDRHIRWYFARRSRPSRFFFPLSFFLFFSRTLYSSRTRTSCAYFRLRLFRDGLC